MGGNLKREEEVKSHIGYGGLHKKKGYGGKGSGKHQQVIRPPNCM